MAIRFICPHCGHIINVADSLDGRQGQCPNCSRFAMIQGQHIPDGNVANVVDITTAPENRPSTAGPDEKTMLLRSGASTRAAGIAPPTRVGAGTQSGLIRPPSSAPPPRGIIAGGQAAPDKAEAEEPVEEEMVLEEEEGVGVKKLILSILAGAVAAALIGLVIWKIVIDKEPIKTTPPPPPPPPVVDPFDGPIFKLKPSGRVAVLSYLGAGNSDGQVDVVRSELSEFVKRVNRKNTPVTGFTMMLPAPVGEKPESFTGKPDPASIGLALDWLNQKFIPTNGADLTAAVKAIVETNPEQLFIISEKPLGPSQEEEDKVVAEIKRLCAAKKIVIYGIAFNTDDKRGLRTLTGFKDDRFREAKVGDRFWGPAERSDKDK